jgi:preprotein translocase subunit YajC
MEGEHVNRFKTLSLTLLASGALLAALPAGTYAAKGVKSGAHAAKASVTRIHGKVATVGTNTFTVTGKGGTTVTVTFTGSTKFRYNGQVVSAAPTIVAGEGVIVAGTRNPDGSINARRIGVINRTGLAGTISGIGTNTLTITTKSGASVTVSVTSRTHFIVNGQRSATAPAFTIGEAARVAALKNADGSLTAAVVAVGKNPNLVTFAGTIARVGAGTLTIITRSGLTATVTLTSATRYVVNKARSAAPPAFTQGERVRVGAIKNGDGTLTARVVAVLPAKTSATSG